MSIQNPIIDWKPTEEFNNLEKILADHRLVFLYGPPKIGKTTLTEQLGFFDCDRRDGSHCHITYQRIKDSDWAKKSSELLDLAIQKDIRFIVEGTEYDFYNIISTSTVKSDDKFSTITQKIKTWADTFTEKIQTVLDPSDPQVFHYPLTIDTQDAIRLLNKIILEKKIKVSDENVEEVQDLLLKYARISSEDIPSLELDPGRGFYFPGCFIDGLQIIKSPNSDNIDLEALEKFRKHVEKIKTAEIKFLSNPGLFPKGARPPTIHDEIQSPHIHLVCKITRDFSDFLSKVSNPLQEIFTDLAKVTPVVSVGFALVLYFTKKKDQELVDLLIEFPTYWSSLPKDKQEAIGEWYDRILGFEKGTTKETFCNFSPNEDIKTLLQENRKILEKYGDRLDEFEKRIIKIETDVTEIKQEISAIKDIVTQIPIPTYIDPQKIDAEIKCYLQTLITKKPFDTIIKTYTPLIAYDVYQTWESKENKESRIKEYEIDEIVSKEKKIILSGDSGSGKTTTLRWLTYIFAQKYLDEKNDEIPFYIELNSYVTGSFFEYVRIKTRENGLCNDEIFNFVLKERNIIFFIDGLDILQIQKNHQELISEIRNFLSEYPNHYLISSQPGHFEGFSIPKIVKLGELSDQPHMRLFLEKSIKELLSEYSTPSIDPDSKFMDSLADQIARSPELNAMCSNPLMFRLVISVALNQYLSHDEELIPANRSELYEKFIDKGIFRHYKKKTGSLSTDDQECIREIIVDFFFKLKCKNKILTKKSDALKIIHQCIYRYYGGSPQRNAGEYLDQICQMGILKIDDDLATYGIHQSFQDYFTAIHLAEMYDEGMDIAQVFSHPLWENAVVFTAGIVDTPDEFVSQIIDIDNIHLAAKCSMYTNERVKIKIKDKLTALLYKSQFFQEKSEIMRSLVKLDDIGYNIIVNSLRCREDDDIRANACSVLDEVRLPNVIDHLLILMTDESWQVQDIAAQVLAKKKSEECIEPLVNLMKENPQIRENIIYVLQQIKSERSADLLIRLFDDPDINIRESAVRALHGNKSERIIDPLFNILLNDPNLPIREYSAMALAVVQPKKVVDSLVVSLNSTDIKTQKTALDTLGFIYLESCGRIIILNASFGLIKDNDRPGEKSKNSLISGQFLDERAIDPLIFFIKNDDDKRQNYRSEASFLLTHIKSDRLIEPLVDLLMNENPKIQSAAIYILEQTKLENAIAPLINIIITGTHHQKYYAGKILGSYKTEMVVDELISLLDKSDPLIRTSAIYALGKIPSERAYMHLINFLNDEDIQIRKEAIIAIGKIKPEIVLDLIKPLIYDDNEYYRERGVEILCKYNSNSTTEMLIPLLKDKNLYIQNKAIDVLGERKCEIIIDSLIEFLRDYKNKNINKNKVIKSLGEIGSEKAFIALFNYLDYPKSYETPEIKSALFKIASLKQEKTLETLSASDSYVVKNTAFEILTKLRHEESAKKIIKISPS